MMRHSTRGLAAVGLAAVLALSGCGGDDASPTSPTPPPDVSGRYSLTWTIQVLRKSDGFQKQFYCYGQLTLVQPEGTASPGALSGFAAVTSGCVPESYDLSGSVAPGGAIEFTSQGPNPPEGPCPGGANVRYSGEVTSVDSRRYLSARGVTNVVCPEFGEHEFTYLLNGTK
jgi:hypothetical protein